MGTTEGDLTDAKQPPRVEEGRLQRAATMATYLRSALGRASEKLVAGGVERADESGRDEEELQNQEENLALEKAGEEDIERKREEEVDRCESETASSSGRTEEAVEHQTHECEPEETKESGAEETFTLRVDESKDAETMLEVEATRDSRVWGYCDVLLQPDAHGLGLNLSLAAASAGFPYAAKNEGEDLVIVASFRRLNSDDTGPAEASGQIRVGDVLHSIEGHQVRTLEAVANRLSSLTEGGARPFVLLRFLRQSSEGRGIGDEALTTPVAEPHTDSRCTDDLWTSRPDVAMLIRELVVKNQSLEEQVLASRLKQDEQRIQLEQLHTLYAKTQLENWSAFSLPKPLSLRAPFNMRRPSDTSKPNNSLSTAAARLIGVVNPAQYDVEFAVNAERERLTRQFEQRLEAQRQQLQSQHDAAVRAVQATTDKKIRMLEFGVKQLLESPSAMPSTHSTSTSAHVQILRHQLLHRSHTANADEGEKPKHDCVLCMLLSETENVRTEISVHATEAEAWRSQLLQMLDEYDRLKASRPSQAKCLSTASNQDEDSEPATTDPDAPAQI